MTTAPPESIPDEWVKAAESHYSMHGAGLIRNVIAGVAPLIVAAERKRVYEYRPPGEPLTHFFHCWRSPAHHACAEELIERQQRQIDELLVRNATLEHAAREKP